MDWELYERQRANLVFIGVAFLSFLLLAFQRSSGVQHRKALFVTCILPTQRMFTQMTSVATPPVEKTTAPVTPAAPDELLPPTGSVDLHAEHFRALQVLKEQN